MKPWIQEMMWVRRNDQGVVVDLSENLPENAAFIPTVTQSTETEENEK